MGTIIWLIIQALIHEEKFNLKVVKFKYNYDKNKHNDKIPQNTYKHEFIGETANVPADLERKEIYENEWRK